MKDVPLYCDDQELRRMANSRQAQHNTGRTILVVEDDEMVCALVHEILLGCGYRVISAHNAKEALDIVGSYCGSLDVLVSDMVLPEGTGWELSIKARGVRPNLKTVYMSGYAPSALRDFGWCNEPYLQKPFGPQELTSRIQEVFNDAGAIPRR